MCTSSYVSQGEQKISAFGGPSGSMGARAVEWWTIVDLVGSKVIAGDDYCDLSEEVLFDDQARLQNTGSAPVTREFIAKLIGHYSATAEFSLSVLGIEREDCLGREDVGFSLAFESAQTNRIVGVRVKGTPDANVAGEGGEEAERSSTASHRDMPRVGNGSSTKKGVLSQDSRMHAIRWLLGCVRDAESVAERREQRRRDNVREGKPCKCLLEARNASSNPELNTSVGKQGRECSPPTALGSVAYGSQFIDPVATGIAALPLAIVVLRVCVPIFSFKMGPSARYVVVAMKLECSSESGG
ncbi:hypothetical protein BKA70DRAFT_1226396 [Coprinopsis sp. MPI-PUGE-AT-0042]|nr:hypothetical protein BKA70DRAFT_1226396 [Coprinopsis sp. MPI-PUGE-AT-0042]